MKRSESNFCLAQNRIRAQPHSQSASQREYRTHDEDITIEPDDHKVINIFTWNFYGTLFRFIRLLLDLKI